MSPNCGPNRDERGHGSQHPVRDPRRSFESALHKRDEIDGTLYRHSRIEPLSFVLFDSVAAAPGMPSASEPRHGRFSAGPSAGRAECEWGRDVLLFLPAHLSEPAVPRAAEPFSSDRRVGKGRRERHRHSVVRAPSWFGIQRRGHRSLEPRPLFHWRRSSSASEHRWSSHMSGRPTQPRASFPRAGFPAWSAEASAQFVSDVSGRALELCHVGLSAIDVLLHANPRWQGRVLDEQRAQDRRFDSRVRIQAMLNSSRQIGDSR